MNEGELICYLGLASSTVLFLSPHHHINRVEEHTLQTTPEVLLVAKEDLVEVPHATNKNSKVNIELVKSARQLGPEK